MHSLSQGFRKHSLQPHQQQHQRATAVQVHCSFSFADSPRANKPTGRRNRYVEKKHEDQLRSISQGLCNFNGKQLQAVSHLLSEEHIKQIRIGMDIPPTNQGRKRQVGLVMRLLRSDLDESSLLKLSEAVQQASRFNLPYSDRDIEQQVDVWLEGLMAQDQEVVSEVFDLLQGRLQDWQQLRTWVRQLQQEEEAQAQQQQQQQQQLSPEQPGLPPSAASPSQAQQQQSQQQQLLDLSQVATRDPEVLQLMQELNNQQQEDGPAAATTTNSSSKKANKGSRSPAATARRSIRRMLKPLAVDSL